MSGFLHDTDIIQKGLYIRKILNLSLNLDNPYIYYECSNPNYKSYYFSNPNPDTVTRYDPAARA